MKVQQIIDSKDYDNALTYNNPYRLKRCEKKELSKYIKKLNNFFSYLQGE